MISKDMNLQELRAKILLADDYEISDIIKTVIQRYELLFPDWEVMFLSLPRKDSENRRVQMKALVDFLTNQ